MLTINGFCVASAIFLLTLLTLAAWIGVGILDDIRQQGEGFAKVPKRAGSSEREGEPLAWTRPGSN